MSTKLEYDLIAKRNDLGKALDDNIKRSSKLGNVLTIAAGAFVGNLATKGFEALTGAIRGSIATLGESIELAAQQEAAVNALNNSLARAGNLLPGVSQEIQDFASALQAASVFGDEVIIQNVALLQSLTNLSKDGLKEATQAAADLAAAQGIDLESAIRLVGRAATGQTDILRRYGVEVEKGATDSETFANALTQLNAQFGGAAAAQLNTYAGVIQSLQNTIGDFKEAIGEIVTGNPALIAAFRAAQEEIERFTSVLKDNQEGAISFIEAAVVPTIEALKLLVDATDFASRSLTGLFRAQQLLSKTTRIIPNLALNGKEALTDLGEAFNSLTQTFSEETGIGAVSDSLQRVIDRTKVLTEEIRAQREAGVENGEARGAAEEEVNEQILESRRKLEEDLAQLRLDAQIAEQEALIAKLPIEDERRAQELERLIEFEDQKTALLLEQEQARAKLISDAKTRGLAEDIAIERNKVAIAKNTADQQKKLAQERLNLERVTTAQISSLVGNAFNFIAAATKQGSKAAFLAQKGAAISQAIVAAQLASVQALAVPPAPNVALAAVAKAQGALAIGTIAAQTIQGLQTGGFVGQANGAFLGSDNTTIQAREGELVLNADQQARLLGLLENGGSQNIVIEIDGREIARAVRDQREQGFSV